jgi:hypothetical protein
VPNVRHWSGAKIQPDPLPEFQTGPLPKNQGACFAPIGNTLIQKDLWLGSGGRGGRLGGSGLGHGGRRLGRISLVVELDDFRGHIHTI